MRDEAGRNMLKRIQIADTIPQRTMNAIVGSLVAPRDYSIRYCGSRGYAPLCALSGSAKCRDAEVRTLGMPRLRRRSLSLGMIQSRHKIYIRPTSIQTTSGKIRRCGGSLKNMEDG